MLESNPIPETGFIRLSQIIGDRRAQPPIPGLIPVSKTTWWKGVKEKRYPAPVRSISPGVCVWRVEEIRDFIKRAA